MPKDLDLIESFDLAAGLHVLRPSEYTAALIEALTGMRRFVQDAAVLEIGCGSGVVLAALAGLGAASLCGVDREDQAIRTAEILLESVGAEAELHCGDLWQPVAGRRFDLVVANLPHFPTDSCDFPGRLPPEWVRAVIASRGFWCWWASSPLSWPSPRLRWLRPMRRSRPSWPSPIARPPGPARDPPTGWRPTLAPERSASACSTTTRHSASSTAIAPRGLRLRSRNASPSSSA
jgi:SAM-dependent methyltransferase